MLPCIDCHRDIACFKFHLLMRVPYINLKQAKIMNLYLFSEEFQKLNKLLYKLRLLIEKSTITKLMRIGIVTITLLVITSLQLLLASPLIGQPIDKVKVKIGLNNETLVQAFQKIEEQSPFHFMYRDEEVKNIRNLNLPADTKSVEEILKIILSRTSLTYRQVNNQILILSSENLVSHSDFKSFDPISVAGIRDQNF